jgi:hypothetical protein
VARTVSAAEAGAMMRSPFSPWDVDALRALFTRAGFGQIRVRIEICSIRYPSFEEFLRREAASSPLAGPISALGADGRRDLIRDLQAALLDHADDDGVVCGIESYVALAQR